MVRFSVRIALFVCCLLVTSTAFAECPPGQVCKPVKTTVRKAQGRKVQARPPVPVVVNEAASGPLAEVRQLPVGAVRLDKVYLGSTYKGKNQCPPDKRVTVVLPPLPKGWSQERLFKWLSTKVVPKMAEAGERPIVWQIGRLAVGQPRVIEVYCEPYENAEQEEPKSPVFDIGLGTKLAYTDSASNGGPRALGWEFSADIMFRITDLVWVGAEFSPGYTWGVDGEKGSSFSISEFPHVELRFDSVTAIVGVRHRVAFNAEGDDFNALMGEVGAHAQLPYGFWVGGSVGVGGAWFPVYKSVDPATLPYWLDPVEGATVIEADSGLAWSISASFGWLWP